jgi:hypothetical protein
MMFAWSFAQAAGHPINPTWPWILLAGYGPICLFLLVAVVLGKPEPPPDRPRSRRERVLSLVAAVANLVMVCLPAVDRYFALGIFE